MRCVIFCVRFGVPKSENPERECASANYADHLCICSRKEQKIIFLSIVYEKANLVMRLKKRYGSSQVFLKLNGKASPVRKEGIRSLKYKVRKT